VQGGVIRWGSCVERAAGWTASREHGRPSAPCVCGAARTQQQRRLMQQTDTWGAGDRVAGGIGHVSPALEVADQSCERCKQRLRAPAPPGWLQLDRRPLQASKRLDVLPSHFQANRRQLARSSGPDPQGCGQQCLSVLFGLCEGHHRSLQVGLERRRRTKLCDGRQRRHRRSSRTSIRSLNTRQWLLEAAERQGAKLSGLRSL
jgi:hypothetical protein